MLTVTGPGGQLCDGISRREVLRVGGLSLGGLTLPLWNLAESARLRGAEREAGAPSDGTGATGRGGGTGDGRLPGFATAENVIFVYLQGAPSHIDLWDPKPEAPAEIRGEFRAIETAVPGVRVGEVLPRLAEQAGHYTLVRSVGCKPPGLPNHGSAIYMLMTGHDPGNFSPTGLAVPPSREDLPGVGAVISRFRPATAGGVSNVAVCGPTKEAAVVGLGQGAGLLGATHDPLTNYEDPTRPINLETFSLAGGMTVERLQRRVELEQRLADQASGGARGRAWSDQRRLALSLLQQSATIEAFRLERESVAVRARYGATRFGQSCLLARRLVEAGTRFVQVTWPARSDDEPAAGPDGSWDTHRNNFPMLRDHRCPVFDAGLAALVADLHERGLLARTLVVAVGEFGRSPKIGAATTNNVGPGGRDHWPDCYTALVAGGGVQGGRVYGESDRFGAYPKSTPVHPYDLLSTLFHAVGVDPGTEYHDTLNRPRRLVDHGGPLLGLF